MRGEEQTRILWYPVKTHLFGINYKQVHHVTAF